MTGIEALGTAARQKRERYHKSPAKHRAAAKERMREWRARHANPKPLYTVIPEPNDLYTRKPTGRPRGRPGWYTAENRPAPGRSTHWVAIAPRGRRLITRAGKLREAARLAIVARERNRALAWELTRAVKKRKQATLGALLASRALPQSPVPALEDLEAQRRRMEQTWKSFEKSYGPAGGRLYINLTALALANQVLGGKIRWARAVEFERNWRSPVAAPFPAWWNSKQVTVAMRVARVRYDKERDQYVHYVQAFYLKPTDLLDHTRLAEPAEAVPWDLVIAEGHGEQSLPTMTLKAIADGIKYDWSLGGRLGLEGAPPYGTRLSVNQAQRLLAQLTGG